MNKHIRERKSGKCTRLMKIRDTWINETDESDTLNIWTRHEPLILDYRVNVYDKSTSAYKR